MVPDDFQLIKNFQKGDDAAFRELVMRYDRHVLNMASSFRNNEEDAMDIYQEVFMRVYKGIDDFKFESQFSTWLYRITANVCISFDQKKKRDRHDSIDREINGEEGGISFADLLKSEDRTDGGVLNKELSRDIQYAVSKLPAQQKMAFTLKYYEDKKIKEISQIMDCAEGTIKRYLFTAVNKLREDLKQYYENN